MNADAEITGYIAGLPEPKRGEVEALHNRILRLLPGCKLWFLDGKDEKGKTVSNPNIGYGQQFLKQARGKSREFYQVGISPNTTGISVYIMGLENKKFLAETYGSTLGKASITGYCIKFRTLQELNMEVLDSAIREGAKRTSSKKEE